MDNSQIIVKLGLIATQLDSIYMNVRGFELITSEPHCTQQKRNVLL